MDEKMSKYSYKLIDTKRTEHLVFVKYKQKSKKTFQINIENKNDFEILGEIKWYSGWRRYVFIPVNNDVVFDSSCLKDITKYIDDLMEARK